MSQTKHYIFAIILLIVTTVFSQESISDDPEMVQNSIDYHIAESKKDVANYNYFEAQKKLDEALALAEKADNKVSIGIVHATKGKLQLLIEEEDEAIKSLNKAIEVQRLVDDNLNIGDSYKTFGDIYLKKKEYYAALDSFKAATTKFEEQNLEQKMADVLFCEGIAFMHLDDLKNARIHFEQSISLAKKHNLLLTQSNALANLAKVLEKQGDTTKALQITDESLKIAKEQN
jgi:hypothetical protein